MSRATAARLEALIRAVPLHEELDLRVVDATDTRLELTARVPQRWTNLADSAVVHGGIVSALLDTAACWSLARRSALGPAVDLQIHFLRPTPPGELRVVGTPVKVGRTISVARATLTDEDGRQLAIATGTYAAPRPQEGEAR